MKLRWLVIPAGIVLGLAAESGWPPGIDARVVIADLAVGWLFIGGGFVVWHSRPANRMGPLLIATGAAWFFATAYWPAEFLYCAPLVYLLAAHPTGRLGSSVSRVVVSAIFVATLLATFTALDLVWLGIAIAAVVVAIGLVGLRRTARRRDASMAVTDALAVLLGVLLGLGSVARLSGSPFDESGLAAYELVLAATVLSIVAEIVWRRSSPAVLMRSVVDLGGAAEAGTLRDRLARAVGDPTLVIGYAIKGESDSWVDDEGNALPRPLATADRAVTPIAAGGVELGFVAHDRAFVGDPRVVASIAAAAGLAISNSATQAEIRRRVAKVDASRERLVHAADAQGRRIESALEDGVDTRLSRVDALLSLAVDVRPNDPQLRSVLDELTGARDNLRDFSRGIYPATLTSGGLLAAIDDLAERSPVPVETKIVPDRYESAVESTLYFVCSEALANVAKHARADHVLVELRQDALGPVLRIADDGVGGATVTSGSGLRGLADRVEALGGSLVVESRPGHGTAVTVRVPAERARPPRAEMVA